MLVNQAYRYELKPNNKQETLLRKSCGVARFAYNWGLAKRRELYKTKQGKERFTTFINQNNELNKIKKVEFPWMYEVSKWIPSCALRDLNQAYTDYYRSLKNHKKVGKPKFKKKDIVNSFRIINDDLDKKTQTIEICGNLIKLPRLGWIRTKESTLKLRGTILNSTINREADRWYCSLCVEVDRPKSQQVIGDIVGIDLGITCFATVANYNSIQNIYSPKPLKQHLEKVKRLHRQLFRKQKDSKNKKKVQLRLARLHRKIKNERKDFINKETTKLAKTKSVIVIEDLHVNGMLKNHHLARSIGDEGWYGFKKQLIYKTAWYGSQLLIIPRFEPSSKKCNHCGTINKDLKLSDRTWVCLNCGAINERDANAAHNIRDYGIKLLSTESFSGSNACGIGVSPSVMRAVDDEAGIERLPLTDDKSH